MGTSNLGQASGFAVHGHTGPSDGGLLTAFSLLNPGGRLTPAPGYPVHNPPPFVPTGTDTGTDTLTFSPGHGLVTGSIVVAEGTVGGLTISGMYFVNAPNTTQFTLHPSAAEALAGTNKVNLTATITCVLTPIGVLVNAIKYTPYTSDKTPLLVGGVWLVRQFSETNIDVSSVKSGAVYDVFGYDNSGTFAAELLVWKNATVTASATPTNRINWTGHGLAAGDGVVFSNSGGGLPGGLTAGTLYFVVSPGTNDFQVSASSPMAGTATVVTLTTAGTGTHTCYCTNRRGTDLARQDGRLVKSGDATRLYLGTIYGIGDGMTGIIYTRNVGAYLGIYNHYNRVPVVLQNFDSASRTLSSSATPKEWRSTAGYRINLVTGVEQRVPVSVIFDGSTGAGGLYALGLCLNTIEMFMEPYAMVQTTSPNASNRSRAGTSGSNTVPPGLHYFAAVEQEFYVTCTPISFLGTVTLQA
jgi:hypothetical protein